ncbi:MAG: hypothetical protein ACPGJS_14260 [Flammeovirgaceae bacterium]
MKKWRKVFSSENDFRAELVRMTLEYRGLQAFIINKKFTAYNNFGELEVYVDRQDVIPALKIIQDEIGF